jgi:hypothetical protein
MMPKLIDILFWMVIAGFLLAAIHEATNLG